MRISKSVRRMRHKKRGLRAIAEHGQQVWAVEMHGVMYEMSKENAEIHRRLDQAEVYTTVKVAVPPVYLDWVEA